MQFSCVDLLRLTSSKELRMYKEYEAFFIFLSFQLHFCDTTLVNMGTAQSILG